MHFRPTSPRGSKTAELQQINRHSRRGGCTIELIGEVMGWLIVAFTQVMRHRRVIWATAVSLK